MTINLDDRNYVRAAWAGVALMGAALAVLLAFGRWWGAAQMLVFLALAIGFLGSGERLPRLFDLLFVLAALINAAGWIWDLFERIGPYDQVAHFFTTFALSAAIGFALYHSLLLHFREHSLLFVLTVASFGMAVGGVWEIIEWIFGVIGTLQDTISDLSMDLFGAVLGGLFASWALRTRNHSPRRPA